jgi:prepilin-type N-terminal cleavage/methylation domain-containing protein
MKKARGFTIVELLIVIIVIGTLAGVTIVAYNGIAQNARNGARLAAVSNAIDAVKLTLAKNAPSAVRSTLNVSDNWWRACIGTGQAVIDSNGACAAYNGGVYVMQSSAFINLLQANAGTVDMSTYQVTTSNDGDKIAGPYLASAWVDGKDMLVVEYSLEGLNQKCNNWPLVYRSNGTNTLSETGDYSSAGDGTTECIIAVVTDYY